MTTCDDDVPFCDVEVIGDKLDQRGIGFSILGWGVDASDPASVVLLDQALLRAVGFDVHDEALGGDRIHDGRFFRRLAAAVGRIRWHGYPVAWWHG